MPEAPPRERAALARSAISYNMNGPKKSAKFGLMRKGEYIEVSIVFNTQSKFAKLAVGKHVVTAKQRRSGDKIFPLTVALRDKSPLEKVQVDYDPKKNTFKIRVNDEDVYSLVKEEVDFDPSKTEQLGALLNINDKKDSNGPGGFGWTIGGYIPWIVDEVEEKISTALAMDQLSSIYIDALMCKAVVANEFLDHLTCHIAEHGLEKLDLRKF